MIEVIEIDGAKVSLFGDLAVTLLEGDAGALRAAAEAAGADRVTKASDMLVVAEGSTPIDAAATGSMAGLARVRRLGAVLPVMSRPGLEVPFLHAGEMSASADMQTTRLSDHALAYETARGGIEADEVLARMGDIVRIVRRGIAEGLAGTDYPDRVLPRQSHRFAARLEAGELLAGGVLNQAILNVSALMEVKSSMGVFVAAPTAGSCGTFPGTTVAAADAAEADEERVQRAFLAGGLIGVFVATRLELRRGGRRLPGGDRRRRGDGSGGARRARRRERRDRPLRGEPRPPERPRARLRSVANRVEAPCLGRNIAGASNAIASANIASPAMTT